MESKSIFSVSKDNNGAIVSVTYKYLDTDKVFDILKEMLTIERDNFFNDDKDFHGWFYTDDEIDEYVWMLVDEFNNDMKEYLHNSNHKLCGNINNIDYDYNYHKCGIINGYYDTDKIGGYDYKLDDCIKRLDCGDDSHEAETDRTALTDWFFETYGTHGICYNFYESLLSQYDDYCY